ncbi:hypothetical protein [Bacillus safensis]|uniref:hypothetical protein n=1 Tax=Bacillus safensis TaxID=561879 RepID=UPI00192C8428|nr:hypothetical protein [Bacillus safensis]MBL4987094.1 hypothetical protein [Bacillus safensis]
MEKNKNNFNGETNFNGPTQIVAGNLINNVAGTEDPYKKKATYSPEPVWRSPFTLAMLTWISVAIGIMGLFPISRFFEFFTNSSSLNINFILEIKPYLIMLIILMLLFSFIFSVRIIVKKQTRHPLFLNFAISGYGKRLVIEKIHIDKCPQCGGKMKYYNKPLEWIEHGGNKRTITKKGPFIECKRNPEHCYAVDPAENGI